MLAIYQGICNYFNILSPTRITIPGGTGLILAICVPASSVNRKSYVKMTRW